MAEIEQDPDFFVITLEGPDVQPGRINLGALAVLSDSLQRAVQRITLVLQHGTSVRHGPLSKQLRDLTSIDLVAIGEGSVKLKLAPANKLLTGDTQMKRAMGALIEGVTVLRDSPGGTILPLGFDYGVVQALKPISTLHRHFGINVMSLNSRDDAEKNATLREPDWDLFAKIAPPARPHATKVIGRLLMADMKNHHCRIYDMQGASRLMPFAEDLSAEVRRALRSWIEAEIEPLGEDPDHSEDELVGLTIISDEEADDLAPPRDQPWPRGVMKTLRARALSAQAAMEKRPRWPDYSLDT